LALTKQLWSKENKIRKIMKEHNDGDNDDDDYDYDDDNIRGRKL
jgi:hypothetical protein